MYPWEASEGGLEGGADSPKGLRLGDGHPLVVGDGGHQGRHQGPLGAGAQTVQGAQAGFQGLVPVLPKAGALGRSPAGSGQTGGLRGAAGGRVALTPVPRQPVPPPPPDYAGARGLRGWLRHPPRPIRTPPGRRRYPSAPFGPVNDADQRQGGGTGDQQQGQMPGPSAAAGSTGCRCHWPRVLRARTRASTPPPRRWPWRRSPRRPECGCGRTPGARQSSWPGAA